MSAADSERGASLGKPDKLFRLARKRLERFVTLVPKVLVSDEPEPIHDLRVWSRRLQQALQIALSRPKPPKSKKLLRMLRQVRQALGPCRNLDVNIELVEDRKAHAGATVVKRAWDAVQKDLKSKRPALLEPARRQIAQYDLYRLIRRVQDLIGAAERNDADPVGQLLERIAQAQRVWQDAFARAYERRDEARLHEFRIAAKRFRYRAEMLVDLGIGQTEPLVEELKELQDALGSLHDRFVLAAQVAEFIGRPPFLAEHPDIVRCLLAELEKDKLRNQNAVEEILRRAAKARDNWARWKPALD
jgi:CHAD domain-containing protein